MCIGISCAFATPLAFAQQYEVVGQISGDMSMSGGVQRLSTFTLKLQDRTWEITTVPKDGKGDFQRISFDGTNMYVLHDLENAVARAKASGQTVGENLANGTIIQKEVPRDLFADGAGQVWLAYASAPYFSELSASNQLEVPYYQTFPRIIGPLDFQKRPASWELNRLGKLPRHVTYFSSDKTFIEATYGATEFVTLDNIEVPKAAKFEVFMPPRVGSVPAVGSAPTAHDLWARYIITATEIRKLTKPLVFPPTLPALTDVDDYRFDSGENRALQKVMNYEVTARFPTKEEVSNLPESKRRVVHTMSAGFMENLPPQPPEMAVPTKWLFIGVNAILLLLYLLHKTKTKQKHET